jgi:hypothetical protein
MTPTNFDTPDSGQPNLLWTANNPQTYKIPHKVSYRLPIGNGVVFNRQLMRPVSLLECLLRRKSHALDGLADQLCLWLPFGQTLYHLRAFGGFTESQRSLGRVHLPSEAALASPELLLLLCE